MSGIDWTTTDGCERCNEHGPYLPGAGSGQVARDVHQEWHALVAGLLPWQRLPLTVERVAHPLAVPRRKP